MILPLILLAAAISVSGVVAYGTHPNWAQYHHGMEIILWSRRLQWPLIALVIILAAAVLALIISGKRRAWWLIGLAPILALFAHRFALDPDIAFAVNRQPVFISADNADFVHDDDYVVGIAWRGQVWAYPYASLYHAPLVAQAEQENPMLLMWSPFANRALAVQIDHSIKLGELEIVSMPANTLLIYNSRVGQFINGITGKTMNGQPAAGIGEPIRTTKTTWKIWRGMHPETKVLLPPPGALGKPAPTRPVLPFYPMPPSATTRPMDTTAALLATTRPAAVLDESVDNNPQTATAGPLALLLLRDKQTGSIEAFDRRAQDDLFLSLRLKTQVRFPQATMIDTNSNSVWTADGRALDGPLKGTRLRSLEVDDGVYLNVVAPWYPDLTILSPQPVPSADIDNPRRPVRRRAPAH